ncbi:glyoxalase [Streptomyces minutiscleroticus]|uniref:Glyoxalase n=1 Tax=Streptomyces minutiscleroticus TaxID=68238 RepID=A0A918NXM7_9ACTN|nr:VOC family protein [Streptomyces minutiscleroticus]GGY05316.1 glyoxalase [Streptomyces minutiscleroticus]
MPEVTASHYRPGMPCWVDLMVPDQQAAIDFYRDLFGWQGEIGPPEVGGYATCTLNGKPVAGIMKAQPMNGGGLPAWTTYLASTKVDATQAAITRAGGSVTAPAMDVATLGRMLVALDPTGAAIGVWQPIEFYGAQVVNEPGALAWNELRTSDIDSAVSFYKEAFSLGSSETESDYYVLTVDDLPAGGITNMEGTPSGAASHWLPYFAVTDTDSTVDALLRAGGRVITPASDGPQGRTAVVADPQGAVFTVISLTE